MQVILSTSSKGGVGKSEVARLTAYQLKRDGYNVGMMDADIDSSNLSTRMGAEGRVEYTDNDEIIPIEKDGITIYSMESAFSDSSFSQSGEFMRTVIRNMANGTQWGDIDYLIVDTPPGTKDIFDEVVNVFREDLLGAIVVGQSNSIDDIGRMTKVCNYNYVPIIGYVENMSGFYMDGKLVEGKGGIAAPFGRDGIKNFSDSVNGRFLGHIPLCEDYSDIEQAAKNTIKTIGIAISEVEPVEQPDMTMGDQGFIKNLWKGVKGAIQTANSKLDVGNLQEKYGQPDDPRVCQIKLSDASDSWILPSKLNLILSGRLKVVRNPDTVFGGIDISSRELKFALEGERLVMDSPEALYSDDHMSNQQYGLVDAIQMGKADVWGEDVVNYMSLLDKIFTEVIDKSEIKKAVQEAT